MTTEAADDTGTAQPEFVDPAVVREAYQAWEAAGVTEAASSDLVVRTGGGYELCGCSRAS